MSKSNEIVEYFRLDRTILMQDGFLGSDVVSGCRSCPILDVRKENLRIRNRFGTSGNAMELVNIFGRVTSLGHTYFRVLCCCLSMFLASVLVRVLHACVALALWKLLVGCGCFWLLRAHGF